MRIFVWFRGKGLKHQWGG